MIEVTMVEIVLREIAGAMMGVLVEHLLVEAEVEEAVMAFLSATVIGHAAGVPIKILHGGMNVIGRI